LTFAVACGDRVHQYLAVAIRRFYLPTGRSGSRLLSVVAAFLIYVVNTAFMTAVQVAGAAIALASF
jgi:alkylhydroperoxidase/carboxymuconolactone decarboxylase family protein YurZ